MVIEVNKTTDEIIYTLQHYIPVEYWNIFDWKTIVQRCNVIDDVFCFDVFLYKLYFNKDMKPVNYNEQHVIDGMLFIDENEDSSQGAGTYTYIADVL